MQIFVLQTLLGRSALVSKSLFLQVVSHDTIRPCCVEAEVDTMTNTRVYHCLEVCRVGKALLLDGRSLQNSLTISATNDPIPFSSENLYASVSMVLSSLKE